MRYSLRTLLLAVTGTCVLLGFVARVQYLRQEGIAHTLAKRVTRLEAEIAGTLAQASPPTNYRLVFARIRTNFHQLDPSTINNGRSTWAFVDRELKRSDIVFQRVWEEETTPEQKALFDHADRLQRLADAHAQLANDYRLAIYRPWIIIDETELQRLSHSVSLSKYP